MLQKNCTITRKDLVKIAQKIVREQKLPRSDAIKLMRTARSIKKIPLCHWYYKECGCLVGTAYGLETDESYEVEDIVGEEIFHFGIRFDLYLQEYLGRINRDIVRVTE